jgi:hypothetical protein
LAGFDEGIAAENSRDAFRAVLSSTEVRDARDPRTSPLGELRRVRRRSTDTTTAASAGQNA